MPDQDPFKKYGGKEIAKQDDPFAKYGGTSIEEQPPIKKKEYSGLFGGVQKAVDLSLEATPSQSKAPLKSEEIDVPTARELARQTAVTSGDIAPQQLRQQQQIASEKGKAALSYIDKELPSKRTEFKQNKLAEKPVPQELQEAFDPMAIIAEDFQKEGANAANSILEKDFIEKNTKAANTKLLIPQQGQQPTKITDVQQLFDADGHNARVYFGQRLKELQDQEDALKMEDRGLRDIEVANSPTRGDIANFGIDKRLEKKVTPQDQQDIQNKIQAVRDKREKLTRAFDYIASKYAIESNPDGDTKKIAKKYREVMGDKSVRTENRLEEKGIPIGDEANLNNDLIGLKIKNQHLEEQYSGIPLDQRDENYWNKKQLYQESEKYAVNQYPELKSQRMGRLVVQQLGDNAPVLIEAASKGNKKAIDIISKQTGLSKKDIEFIKTGDLPSEGFVGNIAKGIYNAGTGLLTGGHRMLGSVLGEDEDRIGYINQQVLNSGGKIFGENPYEQLQASPTIIDKDLQEVRNPNAGKYNYNAASLKNFAGNAIGGLAGFVLGTKGVGALGVGDRAAMWTNVIAGGYENKYQKAGQLNPNASDAEKNLYALITGSLEAAAFEFLPKEKLGLAKVDNAMSKELLDIVKGGTIQNIDKEALKSTIAKAWDGIAKSAGEAGKVTAALKGAAVANHIISAMVGNKESQKEISSDLVEEFNPHKIGEEFMGLMLPLGLMEVPNSIKHSSQFKESLYDAGINPQTYKTNLAQMVEKGQMTESEANKRLEVVDVMNNITKSTPNDNPSTSTPLTHNQKVEYAYNRLKEVATKAKKEGVKDDAALSQFYDKNAKELVDERKAIIDGTHDEYKNTVDLYDRVNEKGTQKIALLGKGTKTEIVNDLSTQALDTPTGMRLGDEIVVDLIARNPKEKIQEQIKYLRKELEGETKYRTEQSINKDIDLLKAGLEKAREQKVEEPIEIPEAPKVQGNPEEITKAVELSTETPIEEVKPLIGDKPINSQLKESEGVSGSALKDVEDFEIIGRPSLEKKINSIGEAPNLEQIRGEDVAKQKKEHDDKMAIVDKVKGMSEKEYQQYYNETNPDNLPSHPLGLRGTKQATLAQFEGEFKPTDYEVSDAKKKHGEKILDAIGSIDNVTEHLTEKNQLTPEKQNALSNQRKKLEKQLNDIGIELYSPKKNAPLEIGKVKVVESDKSGSDNVVEVVRLGLIDKKTGQVIKEAEVITGKAPTQYTEAATPNKESGGVSGSALRDVPQFAAKSDKHFEYVPIEEVDTYKEFDRETDKKFDKKELDDLTEDIRVNGIKKPIQIKVDSNGKALIVEGNTRLAAAKRLGIKNIPVEIIEGEFGSINKEKTKALPDVGRGELQRRQQTELGLKDNNGAYSKGFTKVEAPTQYTEAATPAKKESGGVSGSALKDVGKGEPLNTNEEAKLKELYKKSFLKQEMTPQEQQEFVDLKNKKNEFKRKQALDNQLEEGANVNGDWVSIHSGGYKKMGLFYSGENWEVNIQNRLNNNILTIRKRNPKTGELEIIHQSDHKTEQGAIEEYKKHNKGIEDEINARFDDKVEKPQAPTQYTELSTETPIEEVKPLIGDKTPTQESSTRVEEGSGGVGGDVDLGIQQGYAKKAMTDFINSPDMGYVISTEGNNTTLSISEAQVRNANGLKGGDRIQPHEHTNIELTKDEKKQLNKIESDKELGDIDGLEYAKQKRALAKKIFERASNELQQKANEQSLKEQPKAQTPTQESSRRVEVGEILKKDGFKESDNGGLEKDGVRIAIRKSSVLGIDQNGDVINVDSPNKKDIVLKEINVVDEAARGKGNATSVLRDFLKAADENNNTVYIEPTPIKKYKGKKNLNEKQLKDWYSRHGFKEVNDQIWKREPNAKINETDTNSDTENRLTYEEADRYRGAIKKGEITADEAIKAIEKMGFIVPKDITEQSLKEQPIGAGKEPPKIKPEVVEGEGDEWTAVRKEKQMEINAVKDAYEKQKVKGWSESMKIGLEKVQKMFPTKKLYDAAATLMQQIRLGNGHGDLTRDEALATMHYLKREIESKRSSLYKEANSDNQIERDVALLQDDTLRTEYENTALAIKDITTEAGRTLSYAQAELRLDPNYGLQIRKMQLMKAKGNEKLTPEEEKWVNDKWEQEKEIIQKENNIRLEKLEEEFNAKIDELQKKYDELKNNQTPKTPKERQKKSQSLKDLAQKIRTQNELDKFSKKGLEGGLDIQSNSLFGNIDFKELSAQAIEYIAKGVEKGERLADLILQAAKKFKKDFDEKEFAKAINTLVQKASMTSKEDAIDNIKDFAEKNNLSDITSEMVSKNLVRDYVDSHIGEVEKKEIFKEAFKDLKKILPDITEEKLKEAYLKQGDYKQETKRQLESNIKEGQQSLRKIAKAELTADQQQKIKLENEKRNTERKIKEFERKLNDEEYEEPVPIKLSKKDAELIRLKKEQSTIEEAYRKKQKEFNEKNKSGLERAADFVRSSYVAILIGSPKTLAKVALMSVMRPLSEVATKLTFGKVFNAFFPNISKAAMRGGEGSNIRDIKKGFEAYFKQMGDKGMERMWQKANDEYDIAAKTYYDYKSQSNADPKRVEFLKKKMNDKLIKVQGSFIYKFIGGSSIKDALKALVNRSNEIEKQFGKVEGESIKDGNWLDKINYVAGFIGRSHSAAKTFSGRFSFAAGFMARLEGAVRNGEDISQPNKVLEIAHESYLDWERGKYQQSNAISDLWNKWINSMSKDETGTREKVAKSAQALAKTEVAITRVPVNILHEAVMEYTLGAFRAAILGTKEYIKARKEVKESGILTNSPEFKAALKERISQMDEKQAATIARCFRKGGLGVGLYALALISGAINFGIFPHMGQKKKKEDDQLAPEELNPGQIMVGDTKLGETTSGIIEHIPALWTTFMGLGMAQSYKDAIKNGKSSSEGVADAIFTHLKIIEGSIPQSKIISPTNIFKNVFRTVEKKASDAGLIEDKSSFTSDQLKDPSIKLLIDKGVELPKTGSKKQYDIKVVKDDQHEEGQLTDKEFEDFKKERNTIMLSEIKKVLSERKYITKEDEDGKVISSSNKLVKDLDADEIQKVISGLSQAEDINERAKEIIVRRYKLKLDKSSTKIN